MSNVAALRPSLTLPDLAEQLMAAKVAEKNAEASRIAAEQALIAALGFDKTEGQETQTIGDLKVTVKASLKRSIDWAKYDAIEASIPRPCARSRSSPSASSTRPASST